jgi:hypothetical protein
VHVDFQLVVLRAQRHALLGRPERSATFAIISSPRRRCGMHGRNARSG